MSGQKVISRSEAISLNSPMYFTGKPCSQGHVAPRYVNNFTCLLCGRRAARNYSARTFKRDHEKLLLRCRNYSRRRWRSLSPEQREARRKYLRDWREANPGSSGRDYANKMQAVPPWLTLQHWKAINKLYTRAKRMTRTTGISHVVDHIIPLRGVNLHGEAVVCGLHVPWNLRVITEAENIRKRNRF
jgi:hypothetical protein